MYSVIFVLLKMCEPRYVHHQATAEGTLLKRLAFLLKVEQFCNIYIFVSLFLATLFHS